jgi:hypothetical protein
MVIVNNWGGVWFMGCYVLSFQVENIELFPEYVNKILSASKRIFTRKHESWWEFYKYYKNKNAI